MKNKPLYKSLNKSSRILTQHYISSHNHLNNSTTHQQTQHQPNITKSKPYSDKTTSTPEIIQKSIHIVNDHFVNKLNPKRSSIDLTSFIQVFRKKIRQTTIARQFENSLDKFKSLSQNRTTNYSRQKGGFVGSCKKQNQLLVQNNRLDNKIKKIIISDLEYKERKIKPKGKFGQFQLLQKQPSNQNNYDFVPRDKNSQFSRGKMMKYAHSQDSENYEPQNFTVSFSNGMYSPEKFKENPEHFTESMKTVKDYIPILYNQKEKEKEKESSQKSQNNKTHLFKNRRLETITLYQRPNLMYNLSLYRKKQSYNALKGTKKRNFHTQNDLQ